MLHDTHPDPIIKCNFRSIAYQTLLHNTETWIGDTNTARHEYVDMQSLKKKGYIYVMGIAIKLCMYACIYIFEVLGLDMYNFKIRGKYQITFKHNCI